MLNDKKKEFDSMKPSVGSERMPVIRIGLNLKKTIRTMQGGPLIKHQEKKMITWVLLKMIRKESKSIKNI